MKCEAPNTATVSKSPPHDITMEEEKMFELLTSVKNMVKSDPTQARTALTSHPNLAYALMKEMVVLDIVDPEVLTRTLQAATGVQPTQPAPTQTYGTPAQPPQQQGYPPVNVPTPSTYSTPSYPAPGAYPPPTAPSYAAPSATPSYPTYPPQPQPQPPAPAPSIPPHAYQARQQQPTPPQSRGPPTSAPTAPTPTTGLAPEQQAMIQRLALLTPEQIALLPPADRAALLELRRQLGLS